MGPAVVNSSAIAAHSWVGLRIMRRARSSQPGSLGSGMGFRAAGLAAILGAEPVRGGVGPRGGCAGPRGAVGPRGGCTGVGMLDPRGVGDSTRYKRRHTTHVTRRTSHEASEAPSCNVGCATCDVGHMALGRMTIQ